MTRDGLIAVIDDLVRVIDPDPARILDTIEPLIRADERERVGASSWYRVRALQAERECVALRRERADLRAKIEALSIILYPIPDKTWGAVTGHAVDLAAVLDLIDGSSDDAQR